MKDHLFATCLPLSAPLPPPKMPSLRLSAGPPAEAQWHSAISERGEVVCPTCSVVTRKTVPGLKKHMEICQKVRRSSPDLT